MRRGEGGGGSVHNLSPFMAFGFYQKVQCHEFRFLHIPDFIWCLIIAFSPVPNFSKNLYNMFTIKEIGYQRGKSIHAVKSK
jgi:hypothetical protein